MKERKKLQAAQAYKDIKWADSRTPKHPTISKARLTDSFLRTCKPGPRHYYVTEKGGLRLVVYPSGQMTWEYRYSFNGAEKTLSPGTYPGTSLKAARSQKEQWEEIKENGKDPEHFSTLRCPTVATVAGEYLDKLRRSAIKDIERYERAGERLIKDFGQFILSDLSRGLIKTYTEKLSDAYTSANNMLMFLSGMFEHALDNNTPAIFGNPASGVKHFGRPDDLPDQHRNLEDWEIAFALRYMLDDARKGINAESRAITLMQATQGYRHHEPAGVGTDEVEWDCRMFTIPKDRSKTGRPFRHFMTATSQVMYERHLSNAKAGRLFPVHYELDRAVLKEEKRKLKPGEKRKQKRQSSQKTLDSIRKAEVRKADPYLPHHDTHSWRTTFKTRMDEMEIESDLRHLAQNHARKGIESKYNKSLREWAVAAVHVAMERRYYRMAGLKPPAYPQELQEIFDRIIDGGFKVYWLKEAGLTLEDVARRAYEGWVQPPLFQVEGEPVQVPQEVLDARAEKETAKGREEKPVATSGAMKGYRDWKEIPLDDLAKMVWQKPVMKLAEEFRVSHVAVINRCKKLGIATPDRAYWHRLRAGKIEPIVPAEQEVAIDDIVWADITAEHLHALVWQMPRTKIAEHFGFTEPIVRKKCKRLGIEGPKPGYWARKQAAERCPAPIN